MSDHTETPGVRRSPPQEERMKLTEAEQDAPREPLLIQAARRMAETHPHRHIRIVSGSGTTVGGFIEEFDEYVAALTARLEQIQAEEEDETA